MPPSDLQERHERLTKKMHEIFGAGLELKGRLERGQRPRFEVEYSRIRTLLLAGGDLDFEPMYRGDLVNVNVRATTAAASLNNMFFGIQYALACWLDELFIVYSPRWWSEEWTGRSLEQSLLGGTQEREWRFWNQARLAEGPKGSPEAVECFLWAVMLGFRGRPDTASPPIDPVVWVENTRRRVIASRQVKFPDPPSREAPTEIPPLKGADRLRGMFRLAIILIGIAVFILSLAVTVALKGKTS